MDMFIVDKIIMMARPSYPFLEEMNNVCRLHGRDLYQKVHILTLKWMDNDDIGYGWIRLSNDDLNKDIADEEPWIIYEQAF